MKRVRRRHVRFFKIKIQKMEENIDILYRNYYLFLSEKDSNV